jgi:hypothetical protein
MVRLLGLHFDLLPGETAHLACFTSTTPEFMGDIDTNDRVGVSMIYVKSDTVGKSNDIA